MNHKLKYAFVAALLGVTGPLFARENVSSGINQNTSPSFALAAACEPATAQSDLDVNNVRTTILAGGDMWWDLNNGVYEIPKESNKHSLFAGSLWIGGIDGASNLKVAAMTYRQTGNDFWPGPLNPADASVEFEQCSQYDRHFTITKPEVQPWATYSDGVQNNENPEAPELTDIIEDWPAESPWGEPLAPYFDANGDMNYEPLDGDYPGYDFSGGSCDKDLLYGDKTLWWVFNDKGNIHTESGAEAIGLEIQAQAFGFATNDEINNMTFYQYKIINRSSFQVNDCYFGQWVDPDLGNYQDDYVGCDVERGLGYCYNGDNDDEGAAGYGINPPCIGVDFFQGPIADAGDGIDNDRDNTVDENGEQIIMSKFVYYNNVNNTPDGNPASGPDFYNYLAGIWLDNQPISYGENGRNINNPVCDFMFPGDSDQEIGWGQGGTPGSPNVLPPWNEVTAGNTPADRRFLQSAGTFTLLPGAVNYITTGVVWARATSGGATASVNLARLSDDKAQALFDNCFKVVEGPDAPDVTIQELENELILILSNELGNNQAETYNERDPLIICPNGPGTCDTTYTFEGYQIFQFRDATVTAADIGDVDKVRLAAQCDIENGITRLVNFEFDATLNANVPTEMVNGADQGIQHTFKITNDLFASGDAKLINYKPYYYYVIAYAENNFKEYNQNDPNGLDGQKKPYLASRKLSSTGLGIPVIKGTPHSPTSELGGTVQASEYGDGPKITRVKGAGNGGNALKLTAGSMAEIVANNCAEEITYENGRGPLNVKVIDPLMVKDGDYSLELFDANTDTASWTVTFTPEDGSPVETYDSKRKLDFENEQVLGDNGLSIQLKNVTPPGENSGSNGFISADIDYEIESDRWLTYVPDNDFTGIGFNDWIRSGTGPNDYAGIDDAGVYEGVLGGTWAPYRLVASNNHDTNNFPWDFGGGPAWQSFQSINKIEETPSVTIVFTADKSKWTRVPVIETGDVTSETIGGAKKMNLRAQASVDKNGQPDGSGNGYGWFPGYAINLETGDRLNMMFGEDSRMVDDNGTDMIWNPTTRTLDLDGFPPKSTALVNGGRHYVYVMNQAYAGDDETANPYYAAFDANNQDPPAAQKRNIYKEVNWVTMPLLREGFELLTSDIAVNLNVNQPYSKRDDCTGANSENPVYTWNTADLKTTTGDVGAEMVGLDNVQIVPNPYYGYSEYETDQLDNRVKITNLPDNVTISIFTLSGTLIRTIDKSSPETSVEWDLKNTFGIPIASGVYLIHLDADEAGERVLKWFGAMRPVDLDTF